MVLGVVLDGELFVPPSKKKLLPEEVIVGTARLMTLYGVGAGQVRLLKPGSPPHYPHYLLSMFPKGDDLFEIRADLLPIEGHRASVQAQAEVYYDSGTSI